LVSEGVNVCNVGGYIQRADEPKAAYERLMSSIKSSH